MLRVIGAMTMRFERYNDLILNGLDKDLRSTAEFLFLKGEKFLYSYNFMFSPSKFSSIIFLGL